MSDMEDQKPEASQIAELKEQCENLGQQVRTLLYGLVVASFTLTAFLGLQARRAGKELLAIQPQAAQVNELSKREEVGLRTFLGQLVEFSKTHPDYAAILEKYKIVPVKPSPGAGQAPAAPAAPATKP